MEKHKVIPSDKMLDCEIKAFVEAQNNNTEKLDELVRKHEKLVYKLASPYRMRRIYDDVVQGGMIGLLYAIKRYNVNSGFMFSTFAIPHIKGEMRKALLEDRSIKISRKCRRIQQKIHDLESNLEIQEDVFDVREVAKKIKEDPKWVLLAKETRGDVASLSTPITDGGVELIDMLKDERNEFNDWIDKQWLKVALGQMPKRKREILVQRYEQEKTQAELSKEIGLSQTQISRLEKQALEALKEYEKK